MSNGIDWASHVSAWRESGETAEAYCAGRDLKVGTLRYWSSRAQHDPRERLNALLGEQEVRLARVRTLPRAAVIPRAAESGVTLEVHGVRVSVARDFDEETLSRVLHLVARGGARCSRPTSRSSCRSTP